MANSALRGAGRRAVSDGSALADANRFEVGQLVGATWIYCVKTGTQLKAYLRSYFDGLYQAVSTAVLLSIGTTAGDRLRWSAAGVAGRQPCSVTLPSAGAGVWAPVLTADAHHSVARTGEWTNITPSGLEIGEGCTGYITGAHSVTGTAGVNADSTDDLEDLGAASVGWVIWREAAGYRMVCWERA